MTEETEKSVNETLKWVAETADESKGFILEQAPLYAQEVVTWTYVQGAILMVSMWVLAAVLAVAAYKLHKAGKATDYDSVPYTFTAAIIGIVAVILCGTGVCGMQDMFKAKYAPRVVVIEHLRGVLK